MNIVKIRGIKMLEITNANFNSEVKNSNIPVLIDFWAPWCMPCKMLAPTVEAVAASLAGKVKVAKINVDDSPELATELSILNIPTLILFKAGQEAARLVGVNSKEAIEKMVREELG